MGMHGETGGEEGDKCQGLEGKREAKEMMNRNGMEGDGAGSKMDGHS